MQSVLLLGTYQVHTLVDSTYQVRTLGKKYVPVRTWGKKYVLGQGGTSRYSAIAWYVPSMYRYILSTYNLSRFQMADTKVLKLLYRSSDF